MRRRGARRARRACPACARASCARAGGDRASPRAPRRAAACARGRRRRAWRAATGSPSMFTSVRHAVRARVGELRERRAPPFEWPTNGTGSRRGRVEHGERVAHVGVPAVERGVLGVAVAALVPATRRASRASASSGAKTSKVRAKSKPPWASSSGGAARRPTRETARRSPCDVDEARRGPARARRESGRPPPPRA